MANRAALGLVSLLPPELTEPPLNVYRATLHPDGLVAHSSNAHEWVASWLDALRRQALLTGDAGVQQLYDEVSMYPASIAALDARSDPFPDPPVVLSLALTTPFGDVTMFTTLTTFGTALDITLEELAVELFWPADEPSGGVLRAMAP